MLIVRCRSYILYHTYIPVYDTRIYNTTYSPRDLHLAAGEMLILRSNRYEYSGYVLARLRMYTKYLLLIYDVYVRTQYILHIIHSGAVDIGPFERGTEPFARVAWTHQRTPQKRGYHSLGLVHHNHPTLWLVPSTVIVYQRREAHASCTHIQRSLRSSSIQTAPRELPVPGGTRYRGAPGTRYNY